MRNDEILKILQTEVKTSVEASSLAALPIAPVRIVFKKPEDCKYLEIVFVPNDPDDQYWAGDQLKQGILRLLLHWPKGHDTYGPMQLINEIAEHFDKETSYDGVKLQQVPKIDAALDMPNEIIYPATIYYYSM